MKAFFQNSGGRGGIRTLDTDNRMPPFQGGTFNHSATLPRCVGTGMKLYGRFYKYQVFFSVFLILFLKTARIFSNIVILKEFCLSFATFNKSL